MNYKIKLLYLSDYDRIGPQIDDYAKDGGPGVA